MKTKHLLTALVLPALFAACTEDAFESSVNNNGANLNGQLVELGEDFAVGLTRGNGDAATRTNWHYEGKGDILYSWLPTFYTCPETSTIKAAAEEIGFAWRGEVGDAKVRTNYKFTLAGFLNVGETTPETLVCDGELAVKNGYLMEIDEANDCGIKVTTSSGTSTVNLLQFDKTSKKMTDQGKDLVYNGTYTVAGKNLATALDETKLSAKDGDPYVRNGIFTTDNGTIFKGDYIVYFPYDPDFAEIDYLPATTPTIFTQDDAEKNRVAHLAGKTFGYGAATIVEGGRMAESFNTQNLSSFIDLKVTAESGAVFGKLSKIILVDEAANAKGFIKKVGLDASKIAAGQTGAALYVAETQEYEPTIVLNIVSGANEFTTLSTTAKEFTVATLPTTVGTLVAYLMNEDGLCLRKQIATNWTMTPGKGKQFEIKIGKSEKATLRLAVDTKTLIESISDAGDKTNGKDGEVRTLGNITLDKNVMIKLANGTTGTLNVDATNALFGLKKTTSVYVAHNVSVTGTGTITVPADVALTFKAVDKKTLSFENPIVIENAGCCGKKPGKVIILSAQNNEGTVLFKSDVTNYGAMYLANNSDNVKGMTVTFNGAFKNLVNDYSEEGRDAYVYCYGAQKSVINFNSSVENEGSIEIANKCVQLIDAAVSEFAIERGVVVNAKNITNAEDASILVDAYTRLAVAGAATNNGTIKVETSGTGVNTTDGELYIATSGSVSNAGLLENWGVVNNEGALKNTDAEADIVDHVGSQFGGNKAQATPGEYICDVEDTDVTTDGDRVEYAMGENMPTTTIRFVGSDETKGMTDEYVYNLAGYKDGNVLPYNFIIAADSKVTLNGYTTDSKNNKTAQNVTIGGTLTVNEGSKLNLSEIKLTVNENVAVNGTMNIKPTVANANTSETVDAFIAQKDVNVNGIFDVAKFVRTDLNNNMTIAEDAEATFNYASYTDIAHILNINGKFVRVVSTGAETANPAQVWVESYTKGSKASIPNGLPQGR